MQRLCQRHSISPLCQRARWFPRDLNVEGTSVQHTGSATKWTRYFWFLLAQVAVHAHHQVQVFSNRSPAKASDLLAEVRSKHSKGSGDDQQHVEGIPPFPADQKSTQILFHLHHLQKSPGQPHITDTAILDVRTIDDTHNATGRHDVVRIVDDWSHDAQQTITLQNPVGIHDADIGLRSQVHGRIDCIGLASARLLVHDNQAPLGSAEVNATDRLGLDLREIQAIASGELKMLGSVGPAYHPLNRHW